MIIRNASIALALFLLSSATLAGPTGTATPGGRGEAPATQAKRDFSTAEATLKTFADALQLHDADALSACFEKPELGDKITPVFLEVVLNSVRLKHAAAARFGDDAAEQFDLTPTMTAMLDLGRQAAVRPRLRIEAGTAKLTVNKDVSLILHHEDTGWFIDPSSFVQVKPQQRDNADDALPLLRAIAKSLSESAAEIEAGKYKSVSAASLAIRIRFTEETRAATRPATTTSRPR